MKAKSFAGPHSDLPPPPESAAAPSLTKVNSALIIVQLLFGFNYGISKILVANFSPILWSSVRSVITGLTLGVAAFMLKRKAPPLSMRFFMSCAVFSSLAIVINQTCFMAGLHYTTPANSALLNSSVPILTLCLVTLRGQEKLTRQRLAGYVSAFIGVVVLLHVENISFASSTLRGDLLTLVNCLSYSLFLSFGKNFLSKHDHVWTTAWLFLCGGIILTAIAIPDWLSFVAPPLTPSLFGCMLYSILGATLLTYALNNWALVHSPASRVAIFIYIQPVIATLLSVFYFREPISLRTVVAGLFILVGVFLAVAPKRNSNARS